MYPLNQYRMPRVMRFIIAGGAATLGHWLVMAVLVAVGMLPTLATAAGAIVGALLNYLLQKIYAFRSVGSHRIALPRYLVACAMLWLANLLLFVLLHRFAGLAVPAAQFATTALVALMSYGLYRGIVFNDARLVNVDNGRA